MVVLNTIDKHNELNSVHNEMSLYTIEMLHSIRFKQLIFNCVGLGVNIFPN